jgi:hypothetical protein
MVNWLADKGKDVVMVNPATTKRNKENHYNSPQRVIRRMRLSLPMWFEEKGKAEGHSRLSLIVGEENDRAYRLYVKMGIRRMGRSK